MDAKKAQTEKKQRGFAASAAILYALTVCVICSAFLLFNYLLVNQRIRALEEKLEGLQRRGRPIPNVSLGDHVLNARGKRSLPDETQLDLTDLDLEQRLEDAAEKRCPPCLFSFVVVAVVELV